MITRVVRLTHRGGWVKNVVAIGNAIWGWYEVVLDRDVPSPGVADWFFLFFAPPAITGLLLFDFVFHVRKAHVPTLREAAVWSALYVGIAVLFGFGVLLSCLFEGMRRSRDRSVADRTRLEEVAREHALATQRDLPQRLFLEPRIALLARRERHRHRRLLHL